MNLRKDDPLYYKQKLAELLRQAEENGLTIDIGQPERGNYRIYFKNDIGECVGTNLW